MNPMGLGAQGAANVVSGMNQMGEVPTTQEEAPKPNPSEVKLKEVATTFRNSWANLEKLNVENGGDDEKFRTMQKAAESWFADLATKLPSSPQSSGY